MRLLLLLTFFLSAPAWAKFGCEDLLDPQEIELAIIVDRMSSLKDVPATAEVMDEIDSLNMRSLEIVSARLSAIGIKHHINYFDRFREPGFYSGQDQRYLLQRKSDLEAQAAEAQVGAVQARGDFERAEMESRYYRNMRELAELKARLAVPARPLKDVDVLELTFAKPFIVIENDPSHPELLREVHEKFPSVELIISAQQKSHSAGTLAGVAGLALFQSPEQVFASNFGSQLSLKHEMRHLEHAYALREGDIELPYNVSVTARPGFTFPGMRKGFYDEFMDFGELDTWSRDIDALLAMTDEEYTPMRNHSGGGIYLHSSRQDVIADKAMQLTRIILNATAVIDAVETALEQRPQDFRFDYENPAYAVVTVPWQIAPGEVIGDVTISLKGLNRELEGERFAYLSRYLTKVRQQILAHLRDLRAKMRQMNPDPRPAWTRVH